MEENKMLLDYKRVKYNENNNVLNLKEYIIVKYSDGSKYISFCFQNLINSLLYEFEFEIKQYDKDNNLLDGSIYSFNERAIGKLQAFVPRLQMKVNDACSYISVVLLIAKFKKYVYKDFELYKWKYQKYLDINDTRVDIKKIKNRRYRVNTNVQRITYSSYIPKIYFTLIFFIVFVCSFFGFSAYLYYQEYYNKPIVIDNIEYKPLNGREVVVTKVLGNEKKVVIKDRIADNKVVKKISSNCIKNKNCEELIITSSATVCKNAFSNSNIKRISSTQFVELESGALSECNELEDIEELKFLVLESKTINNCSQLREIKNQYINEIKSNSIINCKKLEVIDCKNAIASKNIYSSCDNLNKLYLHSLKYNSSTKEIKILNYIDNNNKEYPVHIYLYDPSINNLMKKIPDNVKINIIQNNGDNQ